MQFDRDVADALARKLGGANLAKIIDSFLTQLPDRMERVRKGLDTGDLEEVAGGLHAIRPMAALLGATELAEISEEMERHARAGDPQAAANLRRAFEEASAAAEAHLRAYAKTPPKP